MVKPMTNTCVAKSTNAILVMWPWRRLERNSVSIMAADALVMSIARALAAIILTLCNHNIATTCDDWHTSGSAFLTSLKSFLLVLKSKYKSSFNWSVSAFNGLTLSVGSRLSLPAPYPWMNHSLFVLIVFVNVTLPNWCGFTRSLCVRWSATYIGNVWSVWGERLGFSQYWGSVSQGES